MSNTRAVSESDVALAAFHLWEREGRPDGMAEAHWHRARAMLEARETFEEAGEATTEAAGKAGGATGQAAAKAEGARADGRTKQAASSAGKPAARKPRAT